MAQQANVLKQIQLLALTLVASLTAVEARQMTVYNNCPFKIWPAIFTGNTAHGVPGGIASNGGWELGSYQSSTFNVPDNWQSGRIWARQECDFSKPELEACYTGNCIGGLHCKQSGVPPATLAEFTLNKNGADSYDVSLVDGLNLPMKITANGCHEASCPKDLNPNCPEPLRVRNSNGYTIACKSPCLYYNDESNCCKGSKNTAENCPASGVSFYQYFKSNCPNSYVYAFDEPSKTALWFCGGAPSYTITFCP